MKDGSQNLKPAEDFIGWCSRSAVTKPSTFKKDGKTAIVEAVVTTENPAIVVDWSKSNWDHIELVREVLLMDGVILPENKQVPLLNTHSRWSTSDIKGSIRNLRVEENGLVGDVHFWSKAEDEISQVEEGHLTDLSAGYKTFKETTVELAPGEEKEFKGRKIKNIYEDRMRMLVRTTWEIKEGSLVPIGADSFSKFRSELQPVVENKKDDGSQEHIVALETRLHERLLEIEELKIKNEQLIKINPKEIKMDNETKTPEQIQKEERERIEGLEGIKNSIIGKNYKHGEAKLAEKFKEAKETGIPVELFRAHVFENYDDTKPVAPPANEIGMTDKEIDRFSISKYVLAAFDQSKGDNNAFKKHGAEFELEVLNAASAKASKETEVKPQGRIIPYDIIAKKMLGGLGKRAMTVGTVADGGYLKGTEHLGGEFVSLLRNRTIAGALGVRIISGLKASIDVPKQLTAGTFAWGAEAWAVTDTNMTFGQVTGAPKEGKASQTYTRKLLLQSDPGIDMILNEDMINMARIGVDLAVFHGAGTNAPTGVAITTGIGDFVGASLDWDAILEAEEDIAVANADMATLKWALSPSARRILKGREKGPVTAGFLMEPDGRINGYGAEVSNQITSGYMFFGDWSKVWLLDWNMFDILVNPYKDNTGNVTVVIFVYADVAVSIASALTMADDVS